MFWGIVEIKIYFAILLGGLYNIVYHIYIFVSIIMCAWRPIIFLLFIWEIIWFFKKLFISLADTINN